MPVRLVTTYVSPYTTGKARPLQVREAPPSPATPPKLLDRVRAAVRSRHYSHRTEQTYVGWIRRFILFHGKRHPSDMGAPVERLLCWANLPIDWLLPWH